MEIITSESDLNLSDPVSDGVSVLCKNFSVKFNTLGVVRGPHQVGVNFNTSRC